MNVSRLEMLHAAPSAGFDQPFAMLTGCHERVERSLRRLLRLAAHLRQHGADAQAIDAARDVMRYFDVAGPAHHEDEERHVLPWLEAHGQAALAARLHDDHRRMAQGWAAVRATLAEVAAGRWGDDGADESMRRWRDFERLYTEHIALEEVQAFPPVAAALGAEALAAMGREMAARRGVLPG
jgi:hemerythrin-like domain-containing protein